MPSKSDSKHRASPSYKDCRPATPTASRTKQRNQKKDTTPELLLRRALWRRGLRYRLHSQGLPGTPDLIFGQQKLAVFVDGDFWHGRDWQARKEKLARGSNPDYWIRKISYNKERDLENNAKLTRMGWLVIRFWESEIKKAPEHCVDRVKHCLAERSMFIFPTSVSAKKVCPHSGPYEIS